jgi:hypothetical protein
LIVAISALAVAIVFALGLWWRNAQPSNVPPTQPRVETTVPAAPATRAKPVPAQATLPIPKADLQKLKGKWLRPDGGYVLDIKSVAVSGILDASYVNPRPIHVAKAEASQVDNTVKVFIELRDVNYPGSTYDLTYDSQNDSLQGIYYQAALQQRFEVVFVRTN